MAKFKYIGNHPEISQHGFTFKRDEPVEVDGKALTFKKKVFLPGGKTERREITITLEDKLTGNPDFQRVKQGRPSGNTSGNKNQSSAEA